MSAESAGFDGGYEVTAQDLADYWERGYWISPKLLDDETIERVRRAIDRLLKGEIDGDGWYFEGQFQLPSDPLALRRVINAWWVNDEIRDLVMSPMIGRIAASLMRVDGVRLWSDQAVVKPGSGPPSDTQAGNIGWHQDKGYWHISSTDNMVTAWIALQDTDLSNGGMRTLIGSHKWDLVPGSDKFYEKDLGKLREEFSGRVKSWTDEPCILRAGQASFHHSLCFHASETNKTHAPRMSVIGHYMPDGTLFQPTGRYGMQLRALGPRPRSGQPFGDPGFPLVWRRQTA